jgi:hypothetical protein
MAALESETAAEAIRRLSDLKEEEFNPFQLLVADGRNAWLVVYRGRSRVIELEAGAHIVGNIEEERIAAVLGARGPGPREPGRHRGNEEKNRMGEADPGRSAGFEGIDGRLDSEEPRAVKLTRIRERVEKLMTEPGRDLFEGLARICREHVGPVTEGSQVLGASGGGIFEGRSPLESTCVHVADRYGTRSSLLLELTTDPETSRLWTTDGPPCERSFENRSSLLRELGVRLSV